MAPFYLKGVAPKWVRIEELFSGCMPFIYIVVLCMLMVYVFPAITNFLPDYLYATEAAPAAGTTELPQGGFQEEEEVKPLQ